MNPDLSRLVDLEGGLLSLLLVIIKYQEKYFYVEKMFPFPRHSPTMSFVDFKVSGFNNFFCKGQRLKEVFKTWGSCSMSWNADGGL